MIAVDIDRLQPVFGDPDGCSFVILAAPDVVDQLTITGGVGYLNRTLVPAAAVEVPVVLQRMPARSHVFCITSDGPFLSPNASNVSSIKLGVLPMYSTGFSWAKLATALDLIGALDFSEQYAESQRVIAIISDATRLILTSTRFQTRAELELGATWDDLYVFNQSGPISWGRQSVVPGGEVSLLTDGHGDYSAASRFNLSGTVPIYGYPVLHRGSCPCRDVRGEQAGSDLACATAGKAALARKQVEIFENLTGIQHQAITATVEAGCIVDLQPAGRDRVATDQLLALFAEDNRYRKIHELGLGLNPSDTFFLPQNFLPNEMRRGVHFGLGLTPFTEFHLDLTCPTITVEAEVGGTLRSVLDEEQRDTPRGVALSPDSILEGSRGRS
jgi:hypothetical protein